MSDKENILQISTEEKKECLQIDIDGNVFDMVNPEKLELKIYLRIVNTGRKVSKLILSEDENEADETKVKKLVEDVVRVIVPDIPDKLYNKLTDIQKLAIMNFFSKAAKEREGSLRQMYT